MGRLSAIAFVLVLRATTTVALPADNFEFWVMTQGRIQSLKHSSDELLPVGSLQKPFVVRAWAASHHTGATPSFICTKTSGCWRESGHGALDLRGAIRESCNTYFKSLARETPREAIEASFREAGFVWSGEITEAEAIGLPGLASLRVTPARLLPAYLSLAVTPWPGRDDVRRELIEGLKDSADQGTASGLRLRGFMAKTGTVPALDGTPLRTSGLAMVIDDAGFGLLGLLPRGTGREAAIRSGEQIVKIRTGSMTRSARPASSPMSRPRPSGAAARPRLEDPVRVEMLGELRLPEVWLKNIGPSPLDTSRGFMGPGAMVKVAPGERFARGPWEIRATAPVFERRVRAALEIEPREGSIRLVATMTARDYANGVLKAELGVSPSGLRPQLAAAVLRYGSRGPRHAGADVCDSTHCAWFVGDGPVPRWLRPDLAVHEKDVAADLTDAEWAQALKGARDQPRGADLWTADCGGDPVSPHFIWGGADRRVWVCARHPKGSGRIWRREWSDADLGALFGARLEAIDVVTVDGQWFLRIKTGARSASSALSNTLALTFDDAHRRLASRLGWDAMPSPALRVTRTAHGFVAEGVGFGHRVGLCLGP